MCILYNDLINNSNQNVNSFIIMKNTKCMRQLSDTISINFDVFPEHIGQIISSK